MPEENEFIIEQSNDAGTGENAQDIGPEVIDDYNDNNNSNPVALDYYDDKNNGGSGSSDNTGGTGDEDPTPSEDDIISDDYFNNNNPPTPSEKWQKFQRVATVLGLASAIVTLIYFITKISSK
jgi:hypothetical protein